MLIVSFIIPPPRRNSSKRPLKPERPVTVLFYNFPCFLTPASFPTSFALVPSDGSVCHAPFARPSDSPPFPARRLQKSHPPPYQNMAFTEDNQRMVGFLSFFVRVKRVERKALIVDVTRGLIVIAAGHLRRAGALCCLCEVFAYRCFLTQLAISASHQMTASSPQRSSAEIRKREAVSAYCLPKLIQ